MKIDNQEKMRKNKKKFAEIDKILEEEFKDTPKGLGFCHIFWARKKQLLLEKYNITWLSPADLNPDITFD